MLDSCSSWRLSSSNRCQRPTLVCDSLSVHRQYLRPRKRAHVCHKRGNSIMPSAAASGHVSDHSTFTGHQAIIDRYRALLHEYKQHKVALADWLNLITRTKQRQAQLLDAEATGDAALVSRFQQYLMIRKRLLAEIPLMREQLGEADQQQPQQQSHSSSSTSSEQRRRHQSKANSSSSSFGVINANHTSPVNKTHAVGQFFAAVNYRSQQGVRNTASSTGVRLSGDTPSTTFAENPQAAAKAKSSQLLVRSAVPNCAKEVAQGGVPSSPHGMVRSSSGSDGDGDVGGVGATDGMTATGGPADSAGRSEALSHLLSAASSGSSPTAGSGRATAAALAALAYKKRQQGGAAAASSSSGSSQSQRPLAMQLAAAPPAPPGYAADGTRLDGSSSGVVVGVVETAKADANALRSNRQLESDVSLEATLQGVPGGLGAAESAMFAATLTSPIAANAAADAGSSGVQITADSVVAATATRASSSSSEPVGEVMTAKFDVYSGRRRVMAADSLDDYFASLAEGHSRQLAAAAAARNFSSEADSIAPKQQQLNSSSSSSEGSQQKSGRAGSSRDNSSSSGTLLPVLGLPANVSPLPT